MILIVSIILLPCLHVQTINFDSSTKYIKDCFCLSESWLQTIALVPYAVVFFFSFFFFFPFSGGVDKLSRKATLSKLRLTHFRKSVQSKKRELKTPYSSKIDIFYPRKI